MDAIIQLEDYKIASMILKSTKTDEGTIENITLDGSRYGIYSFIDQEHEIKLEYLTKQELNTIEEEYANLIQNNLKMSFPITWLSKFDFITHTLNQNVNFIIKSSGLKSKAMNLPGYFTTTIKMIERVMA